MGDPFAIIVDEITLGEMISGVFEVGSKKSSGSLFIELNIKNEIIITTEVMPAPMPSEGP